MSKKPTLKAAREAAMKGDADTAIAGLTTFADGGDQSACASLAELYAFKNDWSQVIAYASRFVVDPSGVTAANVFDDQIYLLRRAGRETKAWERIAGALATPKLKAANALKILNALRDYCARKGNAPHEIVALWADEPRPEAERRALYDNAVKNVFTLKPKLKKDPDGLARHLYSLAKVFEVTDEIARLYPEREDLRTFDDACDYARCVAAKHPAAAWKAIEAKAGDFWPLDAAQVAPVVLLYDDAIAPVVTPERALKILGMARGKHAKTK